MPLCLLYLWKHRQAHSVGRFELKEEVKKISDNEAPPRNPTRGTRNPRWLRSCEPPASLLNSRYRADQFLDIEYGTARAILTNSLFNATHTCVMILNPWQFAHMCGF